MDVGGTKILAAVVSRDGSLGARLERPSDHSSQDALLAELDALVEELHRAEPAVAALGFGIPSRIDQRAGRAIKSVNIPLEGVDFRDRMRERHGLPSRSTTTATPRRSPSGRPEPLAGRARS